MATSTTCRLYPKLETRMLSSGVCLRMKSRLRRKLTTPRQSKVKNKSNQPMKYYIVVWFHVLMTFSGSETPLLPGKMKLTEISHCLFRTTAVHRTLGSAYVFWKAFKCPNNLRRAFVAERTSSRTQKKRYRRTSLCLLSAILQKSYRYWMTLMHIVEDGSLKRF